MLQYDKEIKNQDGSLAISWSMDFNPKGPPTPIYGTRKSQKSDPKGH